MNARVAFLLVIILTICFGAVRFISQDNSLFVDVAFVGLVIGALLLAIRGWMGVLGILADKLRADSQTLQRSSPQSGQQSGPQSGSRQSSRSDDPRRRSNG